MNKYIIACDSFKECLSSAQAADGIEAGLRITDSGREIVKIAIADGGEGTVEALRQAVKVHGAGQLHSSAGTDSAAVWTDYQLVAVDPLGRPIVCTYGSFGNTAVIETASACGLALLSEDERNPLYTSTYGLGMMVKDAMDKGYRRIIVGLGGSATNDAGGGMLQALGYRFFDKDGRELPAATTEVYVHGASAEGQYCCGATLSQIARIEREAVPTALGETEFIIACDVANPLYGPDGAACVFAPQKGADEETVEILDRGLKHFAEVLKEHFKEGGSRIAEEDFCSRPGAGAAGGLGMAFMAVLGAKSRRGIDLVLDAVGFESLLGEAAMVITGEGHMDSQTLEGKVPFGVLQRVRNFAASHYGSPSAIPVVALCGRLDEEAALYAAGFDRLIEVSDRNLPLKDQLDPDRTLANIKRIALSL